MANSGGESSEEKVDGKSSSEEEEEETKQCEKCGQTMEAGEGNGDYCHDCNGMRFVVHFISEKEAKMIGRVNSLKPRLPYYLEVKDVQTCHRKPCTDCGKKKWVIGEDWYVYNWVNPSGTAKFCIDCAENKFQNGNKPNEKMTRIDRLRKKLPSCMTVKKVVRKHRKACSECGKQEWLRGDWYVFNSEEPIGSYKYCLDCAEKLEWDSDDKDDDQRKRKQASQGRKRGAVGPNGPPDWVLFDRLLFEPHRKKNSTAGSKKRKKRKKA